MHPALMFYAIKIYSKLTVDYMVAARRVYFRKLLALDDKIIINFLIKKEKDKITYFFQKKSSHFFILIITIQNARWVAGKE